MLTMRSKKGSDNISTIGVVGGLLLVLMLVAWGGYFIKGYLSEPLSDAKEKYSASEYGDFGDVDGDNILNIQDNCPAKACNPYVDMWDDTTLEKKPSSDRYGCTAGQERCGTSMECRKQDGC